MRRPISSLLLCSLILGFALLSFTEASDDSRRFVRFDSEDPQWMTESEIQDRLHNSPTPWVNFQDLTEHPHLGMDSGYSAPFRAPSPLPTRPSQTHVVPGLLEDVSEV